jgi:hypothetical protein
VQVLVELAAVEATLVAAHDLAAWSAAVSARHTRSATDSDRQLVSKTNAGASPGFWPAFSLATTKLVLLMWNTANGGGGLVAMLSSG